MELSKEKREWLEGKLTPEDLAELDAAIDAKAKEAEGMEYKDSDAESADEVEQDAAAPDPEPEPDAEPAQPDYVTRDEMTEVLTALTGQMDTIAGQLEEFGKSLKELHEEDERLAKTFELTPAASSPLLEIVTGSVIGKQEARVDGRTKLANAAPKETEPNAEKDGAVGVIRTIFEDWRQAVPEATQ